MHDEPEQELLQRARAGERRALGALLERHQAQIYRFGLKMCRDPEDAQDVLQDTLIAAARGVADFRGASALSTWLYTIARSYCIKKRRRRKCAPAELCSLDGEAAQLADPGPAQDEVMARHQLDDALERAIDALPPMYREVLLLRDVEGLSALEVSEVLGVKVPAVKSRLHRARLSLRTALAPLVAGAEEAPAAPGVCPDVLGLFSRHLEGQISARACAEMEQHLQRCARCSVTCDSLKRSLALCRTAGPRVQEVPAGVQASVRRALGAFLAESA